MSDLIWKIKSAFRKFFPIALVGAALYWGYGLYRKGTFSHGVKHAITSVLHKIPFFGSRFAHLAEKATSSIAYSAPHSSYSSHNPHLRLRGRARRHKARHHRRHRRY